MPSFLGGCSLGQNWFSCPLQYCFRFSPKRDKWVRVKWVIYWSTSGLASSTWNALQEHETTMVENWLHAGIGPSRTHSHLLKRAAHPTELHMVLLGGMMNRGRSIVHN
jgi:hypothetical protein